MKRTGAGQAHAGSDLLALIQSIVTSRQKKRVGSRLPTLLQSAQPAEAMTRPCSSSPIGYSPVVEYCPSQSVQD
jgi:hypothetical protein